MDQSTANTPTTSLSYEDRKRILDEKIHTLVSEGYTVKHSNDTSATLVVPGRDLRIILNFVMGMVTFGIWLLIWGILILMRPSAVLMKPLFMEVTEDGTFRATTRGLLGETIEDHTHRVEAAFEAGAYEPATGASQYAPQNTLFENAPEPVAVVEPKPVPEPPSTQPTEIKYGIRAKLVILPEHVELWTGGKLRRSLPLANVSGVEVGDGRIPSVTIHGSGDEVFLHEPGMSRGFARQIHDALVS